MPQDHYPRTFSQTETDRMVKEAMIREWWKEVWRKVKMWLMPTLYAILTAMFFWMATKVPGITQLSAVVAGILFAALTGLSLGVAILASRKK